MPMTYADFQQYCARFGFIEMPLTEKQFNYCVETGLSDDAIYGVACDVLADVEFETAVIVNRMEDVSNA